MKSVFYSAFVSLLVAGCGAAPQATDARAEQGGRPEIIVSLNLCTDQLLVALADRDQIAGLSANAADHDMSWVADRVDGLTILGSSAEQVLAIQPDLLLGMPASRSGVLGPLHDQNYAMLDLHASQNVDDIYSSIRLTADAVGHSARGEDMVKAMQQDLSQIAPVGKGRVAAYYQRRGYMSGTGTLIDDMIRRLGLVNLAARQSDGALAHLGLEEMVAAQPDFIIMESATQIITDQGSEMLHHDALRHIPRLYVPEAMTVCGNPSYAVAARLLQRQILAHDRSR